MLRIIMGMCLVVLAVRGLDWVEQWEAQRIQAEAKWREEKLHRDIMTRLEKEHVDDLR